MTVLILGAGGLLGSAFAEANEGAHLVKAGRRELKDGPAELVRSAGASVVINCAADTDVEGAERDSASSLAANSVLPGILAEACKQVGVVLVHISSTGCYGVAEQRPYAENDVPAPTTAHHKHKLEGEDRIKASGCEALILRTGWLFGGKPGQPKNFVWNRMVEAAAKPRMASDPYQIGNPTFVGDVARQAALLLERGVRGTLNCISGPAATRLEYVRAIVAASGLPCEVIAADAPFKRLARVSPNEAAEPRRLRELGLDIMPPWTDALPCFVAQLAETDAWRRLRAEHEVRS